MREIKFRAWLKEEKIMIDVSEIDFHSEEVSGFDESDVFYEGYGYDYAELIQFTGLRDKNGKEIYEGDIVVFKNVFNKDKFVGRVMYYSGCKPILWDGKHSIDLAETNEEDLEIIGDMFGNPELLEGNNE